MDEIDDINEIMAFLDNREDTPNLDGMPQLALRATRNTKSRYVARPTPIRHVNDSLAMMKVAVENSVSIQDRIREISANLKQNHQDVVHYRLPSDLVLSSL